MKSRKILSLVISAAMIIGTGTIAVPAFAEDEETPTTDCIEIIDESGNENKVEWNGDVVNEDKGRNAVLADGSGVTVEVSGDVKSEGAGVTAVAGAAVTVGGDVTAAGYGVNIGWHWCDDAGATIIVKGDVTVTGDLSAVVCDVENDCDNDNGTIIVAGDVHSEGSTDLQVDCSDYTDALKTMENVQLAVGSVDPDKVSASIYDIDQHKPLDQDAAKELLLESIRYIVSIDEDSETDAISYEGTKDFHGFNTAYAGDKITVSVDTEGRTLESFTAGKYAEVSQNEDGTWTVLVKDGGDLKLCAVFAKLEDGKIRVSVSQPEETDYSSYNNWIYGGSFSGIVTDSVEQGVAYTKNITVADETINIVSDVEISDHIRLLHISPEMVKTLTAKNITEISFKVNGNEIDILVSELAAVFADSSAEKIIVSFDLDSLAAAAGILIGGELTDAGDAIELTVR